MGEQSADQTPIGHRDRDSVLVGSAVHLDGPQAGEAGGRGWWVHVASQDPRFPPRVGVGPARTRMVAARGPTTGATCEGLGMSFANHDTVQTPQVHTS